MKFLLVFLALSLAYAEEPVIETPDERQVSILNMTKDLSEDDLVTDTNITITVSVTNPGPDNITNVVIYDELPAFFKLFEGENNTAVFDLVPVNATVNLTYVVQPILSGIHFVDSASVNFTMNGTRRHEESYAMGEYYITQYKGFFAILMEWAVIVFVGCVIALVWITYQNRSTEKQNKILRSKGFFTPKAQPTEAEENGKVKKSESPKAGKKEEKPVEQKTEAPKEGEKPKQD
ncbi:hypothetical protein EIN_044280 [Entamoeba invadens IP1]|uniref:Translocon-associated protein subunit alpha n=2 Tax=Entamoeba invadens TaxID=33085 RepID=A0A0A1TZ61_ENTIV|nr:hypothetical protein EIN_044280 [Entamoeba invadens IP1]ELP86870.1 hypothetical protein EIN_044280 [Entamoeba invadens IP1]BAN41804.1 hypothetical protein [Entamoeba invadens]|eukprot:XP_004253641.1 hypothetical protein EIN_044280 [Entamoeba invadens IP1]